MSVCGMSLTVTRLGGFGASVPGGGGGLAAKERALEHKAVWEIEAAFGASLLANCVWYQMMIIHCS